MSVLDVLYPFAGPCGICGGPDKRHRLADAIIENVRAGDSPAMVAAIYSDDVLPISVEAVNTLVDHAAKRTRQHKKRWPERGEETV